MTGAEGVKGEKSQGGQVLQDLVSHGGDFGFRHLSHDLT